MKHNKMDESELEKRLRQEGLKQEIIKAPEGFTENVMAAVYALPPGRRPAAASKAAGDDRWRLMYRRLGYSFILTAGIIMFSIIIPGMGLHPDSISARVQNDIESSGSDMKGLLMRIDNGIMGIFTAPNGTHTEFEGGSDNGIK